ncbi:DMT family transporter [Mycetocola zhujimingii]|uniref:EamA/RhaT family transporter n=1 Tax=Mycetocola zhujimingii TaxID=2079792 RepID=A0A2U1TES5_9MICO|nr:DMT family transporter [Mycetocola zhujimingii]AWB85818.1 EamA/RhaT family transporter [Mycetocola zhujimingii]PWC07407.1 EamA/RhaT family transporter [Mycetocola zhujimingii]
MSKQVGVLGAVVTVLGAAGFVVSWSSGFVIAAMATVDVAPATVLAWRFVPVALLLVILAWSRKLFRGVSAADIGHQALVGLFAQFGYCVFVYASVASGITAGTTALIDAVQPLIVATLVGPLLGLRVRLGQWGGLILGALGVLLVVQTQMTGSDAPPLAWLLPALAMVCLVGATFLDRRATVQLPVLTTMTIHVTVTAVASLILAAGTGTLLPPASPMFWLQIVLMAIFPTLAAYGLYWWLLRRVGITALNALLFLVAPTTAVAGFLMLGEPLTALTLVGFALCGAGVAAVLVGELKNRPTDAVRSEQATTQADAPAREGARR